MIGIYKITSPSGKIYIGQSKNIESRWIDYRQNRVGKKQLKLVNSFKKYGVQNHVFETVCECDFDELNDKEVYYISFYQSFNTKHGLNLVSGGGAGRTVSDETRRKIGLASLGNKNSVGKFPSAEARQKMRDRKLGRKLSLETRRRMSESHIGTVFSEEHRRKLSKWQIGKSVSLETRRRMSLGHLKRRNELLTLTKTASQAKGVLEGRAQVKEEIKKEQDQ